MAKRSYLYHKLHGTRVPMPQRLPEPLPSHLEVREEEVVVAEVKTQEAPKQDGGDLQPEERMAKIVAAVRTIPKENYTKNTHLPKVGDVRTASGLDDVKQDDIEAAMELIAKEQPSE